MKLSDIKFWIRKVTDWGLVIEREIRPFKPLKPLEILYL